MTRNQTARGRRVAYALGLSLLGTVLACSASDRSTSSPGSKGGDTPPPASTGEVVSPDAVIGKLRGKVFAPEGTIPVGGALVALLDKEPEPLPTGLHCAKCVPLDTGVPFVNAAADGSFELPVHKAGRAYLVVQKGSFRRVRAIDLISGDQEAPRVMSTLPAKNDAAKGDTIPKIAVVMGEFDRIERSLVKLGLGKLVADEVDKSTLPFDFYDDPSPSSPKSGARLLADPSLLSQYEIVLLPCSGGSGTTCDDTRPSDPAIQKGLHDFVEQGGRVYASDYNYEFVRQVWPGTISWEGESKAVGSACEKTSYDAPAVVDDGELHDWLGAIGHGSVTLKASWTTMTGVHEVDATDADGNPKKVTPHVWMSAQKPDGTHPATVSFERGCGRVMFSTFHTAGAARDPLMAQEKALLYVLLEVGVCIDTSIPK